MNLASLTDIYIPTNWIVAIATVAAIMAAIWVLRYFVTKRLSVIAAATVNPVDDILLVLIENINILLLFVVVLFFVSKSLELPERIIPILKSATIVAMFVQIGIWGNHLISLFLNRAREKAPVDKVNLSAQRAIGLLGRFVLWSLVAAMMLENLGIHLSALLAGVGIGGIALALAAQNTLNDLFCYITIIMDKPFIAHDFIVVGDLMGTVEQIGIKTTRIRSLSGEQLIFSNHDLVSSRVRNYKTLAERRVLFNFGIVYESSMDVIKRIPTMVRDIITSIEGTRFDRAHLARFGNFSIDFEVVYYVLDRDYNRYMDIQQQINIDVFQSFKAEGIEFAYPTQSLYLKNPLIEANSGIADEREQEVVVAKEQKPQ
ncbi:MAG: mechanosensitive ion channel family protein [Candidatus Zixiibacteriota bacterium]